MSGEQPGLEPNKTLKSWEQTQAARPGVRSNDDTGCHPLGHWVVCLSTSKSGTTKSPMSLSAFMITATYRALCAQAL